MNRSTPTKNHEKEKRRAEESDRVNGELNKLYLRQSQVHQEKEGERGWKRVVEKKTERQG